MPVLAGFRTRATPTVLLEARSPHATHRRPAASPGDNSSAQAPSPSLQPAQLCPFLGCPCRHRVGRGGVLPPASSSRGATRQTCTLPSTSPRHAERMPARGTGSRRRACVAGWSRVRRRRRAAISGSPAGRQWNPSARRASPVPGPGGARAGRSRFCSSCPPPGGVAWPRRCSVKSSARPRRQGRGTSRWRPRRTGCRRWVSGGASPSRLRTPLWSAQPLPQPEPRPQEPGSARQEVDPDQGAQEHARLLHGAREQHGPEQRRDQAVGEHPAPGKVPGQ